MARSSWCLSPLPPRASDDFLDKIYRQKKTLLVLQRPVAGSSPEVAQDVPDALVWHEVVKWIDDVVQRQTSKSAGLLQVVSILAAVVTFTASRINLWLAIAAVVLLFLIAVLLIINLRLVVWNDGEIYVDPKRDAESLYRLARYRGARLTISLYLLVISVLFVSALALALPLASNASADREGAAVMVRLDDIKTTIQKESGKTHEILADIKNRLSTRDGHVGEAATIDLLLRAVRDAQEISARTIREANETALRIVRDAQQNSEQIIQSARSAVALLAYQERVPSIQVSCYACGESLCRRSTSGKRVTKVPTTCRHAPN